MTTEKKLDDFGVKFREIFEVLMFGTSVECRDAKKLTEKLWRVDSKKFQDGASVVFEYMDRYDEIKTNKNRASFISGLGMFFLVVADDNYEYIKNFILKVIQSENGHIREATRHASFWWRVSVDERADPSEFRIEKDSSRYSPENQKIAQKQYIELVKELESLMDKCKIDEDENAEYINEMKPSVYKSLQQLWSDFTESNTYRKILEKTRPISLELYSNRIELKGEISKLLAKTKSDYDLDDVLETIFLESGSKDFNEIIRMFDNGGDIRELSNIVELVSDAWNHFPHRRLEGRAPVEMR